MSARKDIAALLTLVISVGVASYVFYLNKNDEELNVYVNFIDEILPRYGLDKRFLSVLFQNAV